MRTLYESKKNEANAIKVIKINLCLENISVFVAVECVLYNIYLEIYPGIKKKGKKTANSLFVYKGSHRKKIYNINIQWVICLGVLFLLHIML